MAGVVGLQRIVFVQPSAYGTDNACMLDAMRHVGAPCRGIGVIDSATGDAELAEMHHLGVRGVRINAATSGVADPARIAPPGWHLQIFASLAALTALPGFDGLVDLLARGRRQVGTGSGGKSGQILGF